MLVLFRAQGLCDRRSGRSWLPSQIVGVISLDVKLTLDCSISELRAV